MITAGDFRKGITFEINGDPHVVLDFQHVKPGKGAAFVRTKYKNLCICPAKFHESFINWMLDYHSSDDKDVIAIDGKIHRHSYDKSRRKGAIHVISAFSTMHSLVLGQIKTDEKSNEITAIPELLNMMDIKGKIITTDTMGCQKDIAEKIQKQGGDYLFAVKGNQGRLNKAFEGKFPLKP